MRLCFIKEHFRVLKASFVRFSESRNMTILASLFQPEKGEAEGTPGLTLLDLAHNSY